MWIAIIFIAVPINTDDIFEKYPNHPSLASASDGTPYVGYDNFRVNVRAYR